MAAATLPAGQQGDWTLYDANGKALIPFDTFFGYTLKHETKVASKPVERGGFVDYNKTISPDTFTVQLGKTGDPATLGEYLDALGALTDSTDLLSLVTPEKTYIDVNAIGFDFDRSTVNGVDRIIVDLSLQEIQQVEARYSHETLARAQVKQPQDASTVDRGKQQTQEGSPSVAAQIRRKLRR